MKVAVFENEYRLIDTIFDTVNFYYFDNKFTFEYFPSSQSLDPFEKIVEYPLVIIDIDLSQKSDLDGYALLSKINALVIKPQILIMTGHSRVKENLEKRGLPSYPILLKPIGIEDIYLSLKKISESFSPVKQ